MTNAVRTEGIYKIEMVAMNFETTLNTTIPQSFVWAPINYQLCLESLSIVNLMREVRIDIVKTSEGVFLYILAIFRLKGGAYIWNVGGLVPVLDFVKKPVYKMWKNTLKHSDGLDLLLESGRSNTIKANRSIVVKIVHRSEINSFAKLIDDAIVMSTMNSASGVMTLQQYDKQVTAAAYEALLLMKGNIAKESVSLKTLERYITSYIFTEYSLDSEIYKALFDRENLFEEYNSVYYSMLKSFDFDANDNQWAEGKKELFVYLSSRGVSDIGEVFKLYMYLRICIELNSVITSDKITNAKNKTKDFNELNMPYGLSEGANSWEIISVGVDAFNTLLPYAQACRYLLSNYWDDLLDTSVRLVTDFQLKTSCSVLGDVPNRGAFDSIDKILTLAFIEQKYVVDSLSTVLVGKLGCKEISYLPVLDGRGDVLVRLSVCEVDGHDYCLFGCLNLYKKSMDWSYPVSSDLIGKILKLLSFIAVLGYRDLIVARASMKETSKYVKQDKKNKIFTKNSAKYRRAGSRRVITVVPRLEAPEIGKSFADPEKFHSAVKKKMPHLRIGHIRMLPPGQKPSPEQIEFASSLAVMLPEGCTFVRPSVVGADTPDQVEARSLFQSLSLLELLFNVE